LILSTGAHGLWGATAPAAPATPELREDLSTDVLVIGAGYTGLSAALHLRERNIRVAVLEAAEVGFGASGRNVGLVNAGLWIAPATVEATLGEPYADRLLDLLGEAPRQVFELTAKHRIECEAVNTGTLHCGSGSRETSDLRQRHAQWKKRGAPVELLSARETAESTGSRAFDAALLDRRAGTIQPLAYARGLARAALELGAQIFSRSPAMRSERGKRGWIVHAPTGSVTSEWVLVATDAYAQGPWNVGRTQIRLPYFNFATAPLPPELRASILPNREGAWDARTILSSFRLDASGRMIFGSVGALDGVGRTVHEAWARRALGRLYPQLGNVGFEFGWYGNIGMTADHLPRFHRLAPNVIALCGYNGRGIAPGTVFGRVFADYVSGGAEDRMLPLPISQASMPALRQVREWVYRAGSSAVHLLAARTPAPRRIDRA